MNLQEILEFRSACIERMRAIDAALPQGRAAFNDTEQAEWNQLDEWIGECDTIITRHQRIAGHANANTAVVVNPTDTGQAATQVGDGGGIQTRSGLTIHTPGGNGDPWDMRSISIMASRADIQARAITAIETLKHMPDENRARAVDLIETVDTRRGSLARHCLATGSPTYREAFLRAIFGQPMTNEHVVAIEEARAASLTDAAGGYAVPFTLDPTVIYTGDGATNPFRGRAREVNIVTDKWHGVTSAGVTASWDGEAEEASDDTPTLAQPEITPHKLQMWVPYTVEIEGDWQQLEAEIRMLMAIERDEKEAAAFAVGLGDASNQPEGVVTALSGGSYEIQTAGSGAFAVADVYSLRNALPARYRGRASWIAEQTIYSLVRRFDTTGGADLWTTLGGGDPDRLIGRPALESSEMATAVSAGNDIMVYGDLMQGYTIVNRVGMTVENVPHVFGTQNNRPTGQRGILAWLRVGGAVVNDNALRLLTVKA